MSRTDYVVAILSYQQELLDYAKSLTSNIDDAWDLVQDTYVGLLRATCPHDKVKPYAFVAMKNTFHTKYATSLRRPNIDDHLTLDGVTDCDTKPEVESIFEVERLERNIANLGRPIHNTISLIAKGYRYWEIAKVSSLSVSTIRSHVFRARKKLINVL